MAGWCCWPSWWAFGREFIPDGSGEEPGIIGLGLRWILLGILGIVVLAAVAGFVSWYFTRYVIDDEELRIETGAVFKNSKRVPFERVQSVDIIQQFAARIFGLAELRIEVGAGDSTIKLRYLTRQQASSLRDYLLSRAHGDRVRIGEPRVGPASVLTDLSAADQALVTSATAAHRRRLPAVERVPVLGRDPGRRPDRHGRVRGGGLRAGRADPAGHRRWPR